MANEIIGGMGFHHVALMASNYEASLAFYQALGMKQVVEWGEGIKRISLLDVGNGDKIELFAKGNDSYAVEGKYNHLALRVDDVKKAYEIALKAGAKPFIEPHVVPLESRPTRITIECGFVLGPDGEKLEFFKQQV